MKAYFPKEQSNPITNMVARLNSILGGQYFSILFDGRHYQLNPTKLAIKEKKYQYISIYGLTYSDMFHYLSGIFTGLKATEELNTF